MDEQSGWTKADVKAATTGVVSAPWRDHVLNENDIPSDIKTYVFATINAWHKAMNRQDIFASLGIRYAAPLAGLLERQEWEPKVWFAALWVAALTDPAKLVSWQDC